MEEEETSLRPKAAWEEEEEEVLETNYPSNERKQLIWSGSYMATLIFKKNDFKIGETEEPLGSMPLQYMLK